jgi:transcriptional regulator with XRE-family HTH domain
MKGRGTSWRGFVDALLLLSGVEAGMSEPLDLSGALRRVRRNQRWTQATLARHLGVRVETVSRWERGKTQPAHRHLEMIARLADTSGDVAVAQPPRSPRSPKNITQLSRHIAAVLRELTSRPPQS